MVLRSRLHCLREFVARQVQAWTLLLASKLLSVLHYGPNCLARHSPPVSSVRDRVTVSVGGHSRERIAGEP